MTGQKDDTPAQLESLDRRILRRASILFAASVAVAVVAELLKPQFLRSSQVALKYAGALMAGLSGGAVVFAFLGLAMTGAAAASLGARALMKRGVGRRAICSAVAVVIAAFIGVLFIFLPFCLGSLDDGTYDCVPLARRLYDKFTG